MDETARRAVEAALAAGATYADARVMEIRTEAMSARNGVIEALDREERAGVGVRALIGSSWGFFAVPDVGPIAARRAGEQAAAVARASTLVAGPDLRLVPEAAATGQWDNDVREDPWAVGLAEKGDLLEGVTRDDAGARRRSRRGEPSDLGHPEVVRLVRGHRASSSTSSNAARR